MNCFPLLDNDFLTKLFSQKIQTKYAKIISLNIDEEPIEEIQGKITAGGPINVDGASACRRTCSLTIAANEVGIHEYYWGLNTKFKLFVGIENNIDSKYDDIIWFKEGTFLITSFNTSQTTNSWQISISGKDKMCLLNGDIGGNITSLSYDFGKVDNINTDGTITTTDYLIKDIIREGVHQFAGEPYSNIIINDLDEASLELIEYDGTDPLYIIFNDITKEAENFIIGTDNLLSFLNYNTEKDLESFNWYNGNSLIDNDNYDVISIDGNSYYISKYETGEVVGYKNTEFTYAGDLIGSIGNSFTADCLDKIVSMLGEYEYFYDVDGRFIFQKKKNYLSTSWNNITTEGNAEAAEQAKSYVWSFENSDLLTAVQNTPDFTNVKNDFTVWGVKGDSTVPIHMRYAIDKKPVYYKNIEGITYVTDSSLDSSGKVVDWREIIYQMAFDYNHYGVLGTENNDTYLDEFLIQVAKNNPNYYPSGITGYERYYTDIYSFWRSLYDINADYKYTYKYISSEYYSQNECYWFENCKDKKWEIGEYYYFNISTLDYSKSDVLSSAEEEPQLYKKSASDFYILRCNKSNTNSYDSSVSYYIREKSDYNENYWNTNIANNPTSLLFWFDFLDEDATLSSIGVNLIGDRPKTENNDKIKSIYYKEIPYVIYYTDDDEIISWEKIESESKGELIFDENTQCYFYNGNLVYYLDSNGNYNLVKRYNYSVQNNFFVYHKENVLLKDYENYANYIVLEGSEKMIINFTDKEYSNENLKIIPDSNLIQLNKYIDITNYGDYFYKKSNKQSGYSYFKIFNNEYWKYFNLSSQNITVKDEIDNLLYKYACVAETINITCLPIYHLQPNTRIFVYDEKTGINGEYIIKSLSIPLLYNGTMSITATKVIDKIY